MQVDAGRHEPPLGVAAVPHEAGAQIPANAAQQPASHVVDVQLGGAVPGDRAAPAAVMRRVEEKGLGEVTSRVTSPAGVPSGTLTGNSNG